MLVLAIDTALAACSAAVLDTNATTLLASESVAMNRGHAEALMPMIARVMGLAGVGFDALEKVAVTVGPGSFTGLRVGISAARGIALATGKPCAGLSTLSAYAAAAVAERGSAPIISAIDARHDQVYYQVVGADGTMLRRPVLAPLADALRAAELGAPRLVGNAAKILGDRWPADAPPAVEIDAQPAPDIAWVAWLGAAANPEKAPARPLYLRAPNAKPQVNIAAVDDPAAEATPPL